jgi:hypothetical protein
MVLNHDSEIAVGEVQLPLIASHHDRGTVGKKRS